MLIVGEVCVRTIQSNLLLWIWSLRTLMRNTLVLLRSRERIASEALGYEFAGAN